MAKKFYAVKRGREIGIYTSWEDCKARIDGFPGAIYKGFMTQADAGAWMRGETPVPAGTADALFRSGESTSALSAPVPTKTADFIVYTDGSCLRNPNGPGGYAAIILDREGRRTELSGGNPSTTNNRMELTAGIEGLRPLPDGATVDFYTDSQYLRNAFAKSWLRAWKRRGWLTALGTPVKNQDLWQALDRECQRLTVRFHWVRGHRGNPCNERCDALARAEAARYA